MRYRKTNMNSRLKISAKSVANILIALVIISYVGPFASYKGSLILIGILGILLLFCSMIPNFYAKKVSIMWKLCYIYLCCNSLLNLPNSLKYILLFSVGYLIIKRNMDDRDFSQIFSICKLVGSFESLAVLVQYFLPNIFYTFAKYWFYYSNQYEQVEYLGKWCKQYSGLCYEVSYAAVIISVCIVIFFVDLVMVPKTKSNKIYSIAMISLSYFAVILTGKRSFMLLLPVVLVLLYILYVREHIKFKHILFIIIGISVLCINFGTILDLVEKILAKGSNKGGIQLSERNRFWALAWSMFKENPILGTGLNSFDIRFNLSGIRSIKYDFAGAHNIYIQLLGETGILGVFFYIGAIFLSFFKGIKAVLVNRKIGRSTWISVAIGMIFLIYGLSGNVIYQPQEAILLFLCISSYQSLE